jgi:VWA domain-containing protein
MTPRTWTAAAAALLLLCGRPAAQTHQESRYVLARIVDDTGASLNGVSPEDFIVRENGAAREIITATPAHYPIAVLVDTSAFARPVFIQLRSAVVQFLDALSGRAVALYTFGDQALRVADFTTDVSALQRKAGSLFAEPQGQTHVADAIIRAANDLKARHSPIAMILVLSTGGIDRSSRMPVLVREAVLASRAVVRVIDMRQAAVAPPPNRPGGTGDAVDTSMSTFAGEQLLRGLAERTLGHYARIFSGSGFEGELGDLRQLLAAEVVLEYAVPAGAPPAHGLELGTHLPGATVQGMGLERAPR